MRIASKPERVGSRQPRLAGRWVAGIATSRFPLGRKEVKEGVYRERDNQQSACATNHSTKRNGRLDEFIAWGKGCPYGCGVWNTRVERLWAMRNRDGSLRSLLADSISRSLFKVKWLFACKWWDDYFPLSSPLLLPSPLFHPVPCTYRGWLIFWKFHGGVKLGLWTPPPLFMK